MNVEATCQSGECISSGEKIEPFWLLVWSCWASVSASAKRRSSPYFLCSMLNELELQATWQRHGRAPVNRRCHYLCRIIIWKVSMHECPKCASTTQTKNVHFQRAHNLMRKRETDVNMSYSNLSPTKFPLNKILVCKKKKKTAEEEGQGEGK